MEARSRWLVEFLTIFVLIITTHLYIFICAIAYTKLEAYPHSNTETVNSFLSNLKSGQYKDDSLTEVLEKYQSVKKHEDEQLQREWFRNFPKTFVYVLAAHTTLGNRHMNVNSKNAQLFYFFTVPFGVLLYYLMIHFVATRLARIIYNAVILVWRREDDSLSDKERDIFERLKLSFSVLTLTIIFIGLLASISLLEDQPYITELVQIIDIVYTITSSVDFVFYELNDDSYNAALSTMIYFFIILSAYLTSYSIITIFTHHEARDVFGFIFGEWVYRCFSVENEVDNSEKSVWDGYKTVPMSDSTYSVVSLQSANTWLHNNDDGSFGINMSNSSHKTIGFKAKKEEDDVRYVETPTK